MSVQFPWPVLLDFLAASSLDPSVTFARASTATYLDGSGTMQLAPVNAARLDHDPQGNPRGLLIEESRTNLLPFGAALVQNTCGGGNVSVNSTDVPALYGPANVLKHVWNTGDDSNVAAFALTLQASAWHTCSIWIWVPSSLPAGANIFFGFEGGGAPGGSYGNPDMTKRDQWQRMTVRFLAPATIPGAGAFILRFTGAAGSPIYSTCWQCEVGDLPSSFIPTATGAATRAGDVASIGTAATLFAGIAGGTFVLEMTQPGELTTYGASGGILPIDGGGSNNVWIFGAEQAGGFGVGVNINGAQSYASGLPAADNRVPQRIAVALGRAIGLSINGAPAGGFGLPASGLPAGMSRFTLRGDGITWHRLIAFTPTCRSFADLARLSAVGYPLAADQLGPPAPIPPVPVGPNLGADEFLSALLGLLPRGPVWQRDPGSQLGQVVAGFADGMGSLHARASALSEREADPSQATELLPDWETAFGLPDACSPGNPTLAQRRNALVGKINTIGGQSIAYFTSVAAALGYAITVTEFAPAVAGRAVAGAPCCGPPWRFAWQVNAPGFVSSYRHARAGASSAGDALATWGAYDLICRLGQIKPAHTILNLATGT